MQYSVDGRLNVRRRPRALPLVAVLLITVAAWCAASAPHAQTSRAEPPCHEQFSNAASELGQVTVPNGSPLGLDEAMSLFRLNRPKEALLKLDAALKMLSGPWSRRLPIDQREDVTREVIAFRNCLATTRAPALATLTVRTFIYDPEAPGSRRRAPGGADVEIDGRDAGTTGPDGTLTVRAPSGAIRLTAKIPPGSWGSEEVSLAAGASATVTVVLDPDKEVYEDTDVVLAEAVDDIVPATSKSFTLKFVRDGRLAPVTGNISVDLLDRNENSVKNLNGLFAPEKGVLVAKDPPAVFAALAGQFGETISFSVMADGREGSHSSVVRFRVGQSRLLVTLLPPPSNPRLRVSNIDLGVSIIGAGIGVQRASDAQGRVEIPSFPHGTLMLDCVAEAGGHFYYGRATIVHSAPGTVSLVLRHVDDVAGGVQQLKRDERTAAVSVTGGAVNTAVERTSTMFVPRGTDSVVLKYQMALLDARTGPGFDDVWSLSVFGGAAGKEIFHLTRNVQSQFTINPVWQFDRRADSVAVLDVKRLAENGDVTLTLYASVFNTGDTLDPTSVSARLEPNVHGLR